MSKLFKTICALFFLMTWQLAGAEAITNTKEGDKVSGIVTFSERHLFSNKKKADIPLPPGEWTVRLVEKVKSNHSDPVNGVMLALDKIENNLVIESINISAYDQNQRLWNVTCEPGISHQPNLGNYDSECFTLDLKTFMTDSASDWQNKLRKKWNDAGISWGGNALNASLYIISPTFGHVAVYYSIPTGQFLDDSKTARESPLHSSKLNNADEKVKLSLPAIREWYQDYFKRVKEGVYKAKENLPPSRLSYGIHSVVPNIEKLAAKATGATNAVVVAEVSPKLKVDTPVKKVKNLVDLLDDDELGLPADWQQRAAAAADEVEKGLEQLRIMEAEQEKLTRLAEEAAKKEKEKQRALEAERKQAAELQAKREAENPLIRTWQDAGFTASQLPPCPQNIARNDCFGSGKDSNGVEYVGEFKNNAPVGKVIITYKVGNRYAGDYNRGRNGEGIFYYLGEGEKKGAIIVSQYKDNLQRGNGIYFDRNGNVVESGLYEGNKLVEYRYVDPATFTRIPAGKIPVISADARLKIEAKQAEIAKEQAEKQRVAALAKRDSKDPLLQMWRDTGFAESQLPRCQPYRDSRIWFLYNCFGSGKDMNNEYVGEFKDGLLVGRGIVIYKNGDRYVGEYKNGRNGQGIYYHLAENIDKGKIFVGEYKNENPSGNGIYFNSDGSVGDIGYYSTNLIEYRYVDAATFSKIPIGNIPVISSENRLEIETKQAAIAKKQADIAKKQAEDRRSAALAREEAEKVALAKQEAENKRRSAAALDTNRINDPRWGRIAIDQKEARDSRSKRQEFIIDSNFSLRYNHGSGEYVEEFRNTGFRQAYVEALTSGALGEILVDCDLKLYKVKDIMSKNTFDSQDWEHGKPNGAMAALIMHVCRLPSRIR